MIFFFQFQYLFLSETFGFLIIEDDVYYQRKYAMGITSLGNGFFQPKEIDNYH